MLICLRKNAQRELRGGGQIRIGCVSIAGAMTARGNLSRRRCALARGNVVAKGVYRRRSRLPILFGRVIAQYSVLNWTIRSAAGCEKTG